MVLANARALHPGAPRPEPTPARTRAEGLGLLPPPQEPIRAEDLPVEVQEVLEDVWRDEYAHGRRLMGVVLKHAANSDVGMSLLEGVPGDLGDSWNDLWSLLVEAEGCRILASL